MAKPVDLVDREAEWDLLEARFASPRPELLLVLGRRRVGKTFLLAPFARSVGGLYYQATRRTEAEQLQGLARLLGEHFEDPALLGGAALPDWRELLRYLLARAGDAPFFFVLDEFPYLVEAAPALPSVLQAFLDHEGRDSKLKIVLCGSAITAMRQLEGPDEPLYARRTARLHLRPFTAREIGAFVPGYSAADRARGYGIFGGLPGHLALLEPDLDLASNVVRHVLDPSSRLYDEAQHMLDAFLGQAQVHYSILGAIAGGQSTWGGITKVVGKSSGSLSRPMDWLLQMEIVRRVVPITEQDPSKTRRAVYRIRDPYVTFWHRFVAPIVRRGGTWLGSPRDLYQARISPHLDNFMGPVFEEICRGAVPALQNLPLKPYEVGEWWGPAGRIDIVAVGEGGEILAGEAKWGTVDRHDLATLRQRVHALVKELQHPVRVHLALFSGRGIADAETLRAVEKGEVLHFGLEDMLGD